MILLHQNFNSQAPERSRGPRTRCARSGFNGEGGADQFENLTNVFGGIKNGDFNKKFPRNF